MWRRIVVTYVSEKNPPKCGGFDFQGKSMLLELFLNMDLPPVKYKNCFSLCEVHCDILKDW